MAHTEILSEEQKKLLPLIHLFKKDYYLVGGTAIALHIGHRRSIDFDLFTMKRIQQSKIKKILSEAAPHVPHFLYESNDQIHVKINDVKITFFHFPFNIPASVNFDSIIQIPTLLDLAAMKAFAFAERAKWKDYADMYFLLKHSFSLNQICKRSSELFNIGGSIVFTEKLFRQQLCFFDDIDYSEQIEYVCSPISDKEIKDYLITRATQPF